MRGGSNVSGMGGGSSTTTYYEYEDILDMRVDADGQMVWIKKIPKRQLATTTGYGSQYMAAGTKYMMTIVGSMSFTGTQRAKRPTCFIQIILKISIFHWIKSLPFTGMGPEVT